MPNEFSPRNLAQPLKPRDAKRLRRNTLPPVKRTMPWPVDLEEDMRHTRARIMWLDFAVDVQAYGMMACVGIMGLAVVFSQSSLRDEATVCFWLALLTSIVIVISAVWVWSALQKARARLESERKVMNTYRAAADGS